MPKILTIDLGTTYFKACLFDERGQLARLARRPLISEQPRRGRCELRAEQFRRVIADLIGELGRAGEGLGDVAAVTFATQTNSFLLLDHRDEPLTPLVLWPDDRARPMAGAIARRLEGLALRETTGVPEIGHQFMAAKLAWMQANAPDVWSSARRLCLVSDYLTLWFAGEHVTEAGAAGLTGLLDIRRLEWWSAACERFGISAAWLPQCMRAGTELGAIRTEVASDLGLPTGCRLVVGCLDQYAGAIGAGNIVPGGISETTGTVLATVRCADRLDGTLPPSVFQGPGFDAGIFFQMVFGDVSARLLEAYRNALPDQPSFEELDLAAAAAPPGAEGLRVDLLATAMDGTPVFRGRQDRHGRGHFVRAILEAVAFALAEQVDSLCAGGRPSEVRSLGGAARSALWRQVKADVLGCPVAATTCPEPTSLGAAMLAAAALGWRDLPRLASEWVHLTPPALPERGKGPALGCRDTRRGIG